MPPAAPPKAKKAAKPRAPPAKRRRKEESDSDDYEYMSDGDDVLEPDDEEVEEVAVVPRQARLRAEGRTRSSRSKAGPAAAATTAGPVGRFGEHDYASLRLKPDAHTRPCWVCPDGHIFLETFSPIYKQAYDFLIAISEPRSRSALVHEYHLSAYSLWSSVSVGLTTDNILITLNRISKVPLPARVEKFIRDCTVSFGKAKLLLQQNRYYVESMWPDILRTLLADATIAAARPPNSSNAFVVQRQPEKVQISGIAAPSKPADQQLLDSDDFQRFIDLDRDEDADAGPTEADAAEAAAAQRNLHSFEIMPAHVEHVKKRCIELDFPLLEEYDFRNDTTTPTLSIDLKPTTTVRDYQEKSLSKMFGDGRARSGIIVLPCGAGKTLVGITAACTVKKNTLVLCTGGVSVDQWRDQFKTWAAIPEGGICRFTSDTKEMFTTSAGIVVTTYTMMAYQGQRSAESEKLIKQLENLEWGLMILDEVHVVPAETFRKVLSIAKAHCKLGLTATLVREDDKVDDLNFLIGPKLYEANWMDLQAQGFIATVQCVEVWCAMAPEFFQEYLNADSQVRKRLLYVMNPNKFRNCQFLINYHEARNDKIIVFSDDIFPLRRYAEKMKRMYIYGGTSDTERKRVLSNFQHNDKVKTIFISKVGDTSIDLPDTNVIIQISSHYGSRRQEAQRLGRILRPKARAEGEFNAFFYSLVSQDTHEMYYSTKRQQFLIDQGYAFKVIKELPVDLEPGLLLGTKEERLQLLTEVLRVSDDELNREEAGLEDSDFRAMMLHRNRGKVRRTQGSAAALSGADRMSYQETGRAAALSRPPVHHPLLRARYKR